MSIAPKPPFAVTDKMKRAGAAVLERSAQMPKDELAAAVFKAMVEAELGSELAREEVAAASVLDGGGDERKKREP